MSHRKEKLNNSVQYSLHAKITFNVNLVGKKSTGKSSLVIREIKDAFGAPPKRSQGFEFYSRTIKLNNQDVSIQIWDTAGQSEYNSMTRNFFRKAAAIILVYDKIDNLEKQISDLRHQMNQFAADNVKFCLVRTKIDINPVTQQERQKLKYLLQLTFPNYVFHSGEVSAKTGQNVHQYFQQLMVRMLKCYQQNQDFRQTVSPTKDSFLLNSVQGGESSPLRKGKKCC